jgi:hypothetical protein
MTPPTPEQGPRFGVFPELYEPALKIVRNEGSSVRDVAIPEHPGLFVSTYEQVDENTVVFAFEHGGVRYAIHELPESK